MLCSIFGLDEPSKIFGTLQSVIFGITMEDIDAELSALNFRDSNKICASSHILWDTSVAFSLPCFSKRALPTSRIVTSISATTVISSDAIFEITASHSCGVHPFSVVAAASMSLPTYFICLKDGLYLPSFFEIHEVACRDSSCFRKNPLHSLHVRYSEGSTAFTGLHSTFNSPLFKI